MNFSFSKRARTLSMIMIALGVVMAAYGIFAEDHSDHQQRTWASLLVNGFFFFGISLGILFFYALQNATETAWSVLLKRVYEGMMAWLVVRWGCPHPPDRGPPLFSSPPCPDVLLS